MNLVNFETSEGYAIRMGSTWIDLHNDYDFETCLYDTASRSAILSWVRSSRASSHLAQKVSLRFVDLRVFKVELLEGCVEPDDARTLNFLGFLHPDDLEIMDGYLDQEESDPTYHMILRFEDGLSIRCFAKTATCIAEM